MPPGGADRAAGRATALRAGPRPRRVGRPHRPHRPRLRRPRRPPDQGPPALGRRRPARRRPAPVLRLDPGGEPPRPDRQPLRPRPRRPRVPAPRLRDLRRPARARPVRPALLPGVEAGRDRRHVLRDAALRPAPDPDARRAPRRADPRAVRGHAGVVARRVVGLGRQRAPVHVRLHLRRDVVRAVPVGLPDDRHRGVPDAARAARPRARPHRLGRRRRAARVLAAAVAGRDAGADHPRRRGVAAPARRPLPLRPARPHRPRRRSRCRPSTTSCSAASTPPGSSRRSRTRPGRCPSGAGRGGPWR